MKGDIKKRIFLIFLISALVWPNFFVGAATDPSQERKSLEDELRQLEQQIAQYDKDITKTAQQKQTLKNQISLLKQTISKLNLQIYQSNLNIKNLTYQIKDTEGSITNTSLKIDNSKSQLADILQTIREQDQRSLAEVLLAEGNISVFFDNIVNLEQLNSKGQNLLLEIQGLKSNLENQKNLLSGDKSNLEEVVKTKTIQEQQNISVQKEKDSLLKLTEAQYQEQLKQKQAAEARAAEIRAKLFALIGISQAPTFGEALETAKSVASTIGIRPAFLLAIISEESAIGRNLGQCVLTDPVTGQGKRLSNGNLVNKVMKPSRDVAPFLAITASLGKDPYNTPVSCPVAGVAGYGGAMGPAQFIPSTWNLYSDRLSGVLGKAGDPWNIRDSFTAAAVYLADLGALAQTSQKEKSAANKYSGGYRWYGGQVMTRAGCIQNFIDSGTMSSNCEQLIF